MELSEIFILLIILLLAIPFGYLLHRALHTVATKNLLEQLEQLKLIDSQRQNLIEQLKSENASKTQELDQLQKEYFQLTMASKDLQQKELELQKQLLEKQYDIPPDYSHLQESNSMLQKEIQKSRAKMKKWKSKDYVKENKKMVKKVIKLKNRVIALRDENQKMEQSHLVLSQIKELTDTIKKPVAKEVFPVKESKINPFSHQPSFKKEQIFNELFTENAETTPPLVIDLEAEDKKLIDLVGMDENAIEILKTKGIHSFEDMVQMKIKDLKKIFIESTINYPVETWPIQARLALRGEWELIEEYKDKD
jgi:uncharacterized protein YfbU (UPF0304 family)